MDSVQHSFAVDGVARRVYRPPHAPSDARNYLCPRERARAVRVVRGERAAQRGARVGRAREEEVHDEPERGVEVDERRAARLALRRGGRRGRLGKRAQLLEQRAQLGVVRRLFLVVNRQGPYVARHREHLEVGRDRQEVRRIPRRGLGLVDGLRGELVDAAGAAAAVPRVALGRGRRRRRAARAFERRAAGRGAGDDVDEVAERDPRQADAVVEVLGDALVAGGGYIS